ncbi:MAG: SAF domain-containing protein [Thermoanaerobacterales bacterium]|nr:SAF domain-containing protein [Thermoanaerobacterales bacterium]
MRKLFGRKADVAVASPGPKRSSNGYFLAAVALALVAALVVVKTLSGIAPSQAVVVAAKPLSPGDRIGPDTVKTTTIVKAAVPKDALSPAEIGNRYRLAAEVAQGDVLRRAHVAELKTGGGILAARASLLGPDYRAVALPPDATRGLNVEVGDKVDLIGVVDVPIGGGGSETMSRVLVQAAPVIFVPQIDPKDPAAREAQIVVAVKEELARAVALSVAKGNVVAVLNADAAPSTGAPVTVGQVFGIGG